MVGPREKILFGGLGFSSQLKRFGRGGGLLLPFLKNPKL
jgi:hypothetical protein